MALRKKKTVKYRVTDAFGDSDIGDLLDAVVLLEENGGSALLYHPRTKGCCASIEMAHVCADGVYVSSYDEDDGFGFINIDRQRELDALIENLSTIKYKE